MVFVTRAQWGAPPLTGSANNTTDVANRYELNVHWGGTWTPKNTADERSLLISAHNHHIVNGGFPYNFAIGPATGNIYEGRGWDRIGAAVANRNTRCWTVVILGGDGNLTEVAKRAIRELWRMANERAVRVLIASVHRDYNLTSCPGDVIEAWVKSGGLAGFLPGDITVPGVTVAQVQTRLELHGFSVGSHGIDGIMGPATIAAIRAFQDARLYTVDGIVGPQTWGGLSGPVEPAPEPEPEPEPTPEPEPDPEPTPEPDPEPGDLTGWLVRLIRALIDWLKGAKA